MPAPQTHREIVALWPSVVSLANDLGAPAPKVRQWHYRDRIPSAHWANVIMNVKRHFGIVITMAEIATMAARRVFRPVVVRHQKKRKKGGRLAEKHLTNPEPRFSEMRAATPLGMAHWSGSGPKGTRCKTCSFAIFNGYLKSRAATGRLKAIQCRKYGEMMTGTKPKFESDVASCRFYAPGDGPPANKKY